uniref:Uncharacterized protein n=1 Tax=Candidatus Kentrum sp. FM TaxID=2126340 RepID=A0A450WGT1_9GAMM|nr:MAG: hypothetical protein BECKFM1743C_GA0114222_103753 [Candidatus Kentron sp. FM]VFJ70139.1 MAG: hypothetical protein BECKFM1743A_GA0114220_105343 [Candidatus Kentron sp. FM]VFK16192.1 MAG: hypothetical protein BECKFM1743B_GA0114221_104072 [Candidatus Kentron sp. FM]
MDPTDFLNFTDFAKLSSVYGKWLTAIGTVNTTVLALVLTLTKKETLSEDGKKHYYVTLIQALFTGIFVCFIGSLLMGEAGAVREPGNVFHLFRVASVTIHVAAILFFLSMILLAIVHQDTLKTPSVPVIIFYFFVTAGVASLLWTSSMVYNSWEMIEGIPATAGIGPMLLAITVIIGAYFAVGRYLFITTSFPAPFVFCAFSSMVSLITFVLVLEFSLGEAIYPSMLPIDIAIYAIGILLPVMSVIHLGRGIAAPYRKALRQPAG